MSQENEIWNWYSDAHGRVTSVSSGFTSTLGTSAAKEIIGHYFWTFAEGTEKATAGWFELENAFNQQTKINKFIFHYHHQKDKIKIAISGEPIFEKNKYVGFSGTGHIAHHNEISIPEISQNIVTVSLDNLDLGIAMFSPESGLIEFNQNFMTHMKDAKVTVNRNITWDTFISYLKMHNQYQERLSDNINNNTLQTACYYFEKFDKRLFHIKKKVLDSGFILIKSELDKTLLNSITSYKEALQELKQRNNMLETRVQDYKDKLSDFFSKKTPAETQDTSFKKILSFYESNIDIGIFITNINGDIENANYYMAQIFGFTTASMLMFNQSDNDFKEYLTKRQQCIEDLRDNSLSRFEHNITVNNFISQGNFKEVIIFYPSIHNPQKIISLFYPLATAVHTDDINTLSDNHVHANIYQQFIHYMIDDIKSSINVISGYNDLQLMSAEVDKIHSYNQPIDKSCSHILRSISDVMQVYKISSSISGLEHSVFSCEDIINECLEYFNTYTLDNNIRITLELNTMGLLVISDKKIFYDGLIKILDSIMRSSQKTSRLKIKIIDDIQLEKINLMIIDESQLNIENLIKTDVYDVFNNPAIRNTGSLNFKIAEHYLKLLKCQITAINHNERGNILTIEISGDMITSVHERDSDNLAI